jgi:hypothetical protein
VRLAPALGNRAGAIRQWVLIAPEPVDVVGPSVIDQGPGELHHLPNEESEMANRVNHQDVVKKLLDAKAVDFGAIGKAVAELGPAMSLADEPWESFCGTMRVFIRIFIIRGPGPRFGNPVENLAELGNVARELSD